MILGFVYMNISEILNKYPIVNYGWDVGDSVYSLDNYIMKVTGGCEIENYGGGNYVGIREYFVRHSVHDDNEVGYQYNNLDPWNREFKAYKRGYNVNRVNQLNQYVCRPMVNRDNGLIMMYVITTSIEGRILYCLDVIGGK